MGASVAGKQWANAVKTIGPLDQITIVLSLEPVQLEEILMGLRYRPCTIYQKMWTIYYVWALSQSMVNVGKFKVRL